MPILGIFPEYSVKKSPNSRFCLIGRYKTKEITAKNGKDFIADEGILEFAEVDWPNYSVLKK